MVKISPRQAHEIIDSIGVSSLLSEALSELALIVFRKYDIIVTTSKLTEKTLKSIGNWHLPWYKDGNWVEGTVQHTVASWPEKIRLRKEKELRIVALTDGSKHLILDGTHRAVAIYQNKQIVDAEIVMLKAKTPIRIAPKDWRW